MCEEAKEIDQLWSYVVGDYYYDKSGSYLNREGKHEGGIHVVEAQTLTEIYEGTFIRSKAFWLPRQDQLQEMANLSVPEEAIKEISDFFRGETKDNRNFYKSMEQLWLAFIMRRNYNKAWSEETWIVVEDS